MLDPVTKGYITRCPAAAARTLLRLEQTDLKAIMEAMPRQVAARVLVHMASASASRCLLTLDNRTISEILAHIDIPSSVAILRHVHHNQVKELLEQMPRIVAVRLRLGLRHSETLIGAYVDVNAITFKPEHHVSDALRLYRRDGQYTGHTIYVLDDDSQLVGEVQLSGLLAARDRTMVSRLMQPIPAVLNARTTIQSVSSHPAWLTHDSLPVINRNNAYQGVLRRSSVLEKEQQLIRDVAEQNALASTRAALADVFWMAAGALVISNTKATQREVED